MPVALIGVGPGRDDVIWTDAAAGIRTDSTGAAAGEAGSGVGAASPAASTATAH